MLEEERVKYGEVKYKENYQEDKVTESECRDYYGNCIQCPKILC